MYKNQIVKFIQNECKRTNPSVCANNQHSKIWTVAGEAKNGGFQVLVVTGQINECDHFGGTLTDLLSCPRLAVIYNLGKSEAKNDYISGYCGIFHFGLII